MKKFVYKILQHGMELIKINPELRPKSVKSLIDNISYYKINNYINELGEIEKSNNMEIAKIVKFCIVAADAGTVLGAKTFWHY